MHQETLHLQISCTDSSLNEEHKFGTVIYFERPGKVVSVFQTVILLVNGKLTIVFCIKNRNLSHLMSTHTPLFSKRCAGRAGLLAVTRVTHLVFAGV